MDTGHPVNQSASLIQPGSMLIGQNQLKNYQSQLSIYSGSATIGHKVSSSSFGNLTNQSKTNLVASPAAIGSRMSQSTSSSSVIGDNLSTNCLMNDNGDMIKVGSLHDISKMRETLL